MEVIRFYSVDAVVVTLHAKFKNHATRDLGWLEEP
jgi:hypothetical protein